MITSYPVRKDVVAHVNLGDLSLNSFFALFVSKLARYLLVTLLLLAIVTAADGYQHRISAELPSLNETGGHGLNASQPYTSSNNTSRNTTKIIQDNEETDTTVPYSPNEDYLLTLNSPQYSVLFNLRQALDSSRLLVNVNAINKRLSETLYIIFIQNRTVLFQNNNSVFGVFKLANAPSWQKLVVNFNHREISVTQECAEFSYLPLPNKPKLEEWETITITVQTENSQEDIQV